MPFPKHVLLFTTDLDVGGTPIVVRELSKRLNSAGVNLSVACLAPAGQIADQIRSSGITVTSLDARHWRHLPQVASKLIHLIDDTQTDVLLSFLMHANVLSALASTFRPALHCIQSIQTTQPNPAWHWRLQALAARSAHQILTPSHAAAQIAQTRCNISASKIVIIPNALDPAEWTGAGAPWPSQSAAPITIGFIGRLDPVKKIDDLIRAMLFLPPRFLLKIVGQGAQHDKLQSLIHQLNLNNRVTLAGPTLNPQTALSQMHLLVLPSQAEGFGLVLIEAMAAAIPVIGADAPGIREVIDHRRTGLLCPVNSPNQLAHSIIELTDNPPLRNNLIQNAQKKVAQQYSWHSALPAYLRLLETR